MTHRIIYLDTVDSTNRYVRELDIPEDVDMLVCVADYQTAGRGQGSNTWESERGKNLLFSVKVQPHDVAPSQQFILSEACALSLKDVFDTMVDGITLKWPNDIYWNDRKLSGTLIETALAAGNIKHCVFGVGINVNQRSFHSDAPNPVSLWQILGHKVDISVLLSQIVDCLANRLQQVHEGRYDEVQNAYHAALFRREGWHLFRDARDMFRAHIVEVRPDGHLLLCDEEGKKRQYAFKEVEFIINNSSFTIHNQ
ncbi:MAG: biotin--[Prevotella sp.]|nr:biotin--[acetyl-CoA-carboxylase] ligase [Prevotella sp.]